MKQKSQFRQQEQQESQVHGETQQKGQEFASVDELIRFDAAQNPPPEGLAERVKRSTEQEPKESWFRRLMARWRGGSK